MEKILINRTGNTHGLNVETMRIELTCGGVEYTLTPECDGRLKISNNSEIVVYSRMANVIELSGVERD